jgi:hypothetical protein
MVMSEIVRMFLFEFGLKTPRTQHSYRQSSKLFNSYKTIYTFSSCRTRISLCAAADDEWERKGKGWENAKALPLAVF